MSEMAKRARADMRDKAKRMTADPSHKVDASSWTPPPSIDPGKKTGARPKPRAFKDGGKVEGEKAKHHSGRKPRHSDAAEDKRLIKATVKPACIKKADGGEVKPRPLSPAPKPRPLSGTTVNDKDGDEYRRGGKTGDTGHAGTRPTGGRLARNTGGRTKGKTEINIIVNSAQKPPQGPMPAPLPPPGAAAPPPPPPAPPGGPMPPGAPPMARKAGGRVPGYMSKEAGAGSGLGRLQKAHKAE